MTDKKQRITSYKSAYGIRVYEIEQYNKELNEWFIVGDCCPSKLHLTPQVEHHNLCVEYGLR